MKSVANRTILTLILSLVILTNLAPSSLAQQASAVVPTLVKYSGTLTDANGQALTGTVGVTFFLYKDDQGGPPLWMEMQNIALDKNGRYTAILGSTTSQGLPTDLFASGDARWLGVQAEGQPEQARVLLFSVPYALKAGDAQTLGGMPASAFALAASAAPKSESAANTVPATAAKNNVPSNPAVTGKGVVDYIPMWDTTSDIVDSILFQKSSAIGVNTITPAATLDVNGKSDIRDTLTLFPKSTDNTLAVSGTTFNISSTGKVTFVTGQTFPGTGTITGITTATGSGLSGGGTTGTLSLKVPNAGITNAMLAESKVTLNANTAGGLTTPGAMTLGSTYTIGLKPCSTNQILQYSGTTWNCATAGAGTITGVTAGTDLTGGGTSGAVTLNLDTTKVPLLGAANTFTGNQAITGNLTDTGNITASGTITSATGVYAANNTTQVVNVTQSGAGTALAATANGGGAALSGSGATGVLGTGTSSFAIGVEGTVPGGVGVFGTSPTGLGVYGRADGPTNPGVEGYADGTASGATATGVLGYSTTTSGMGTEGVWSSNSSFAPYLAQAGVWGDSSTGSGVIGSSNNGTGVAGYSTDLFGIFGSSQSYYGVFGVSNDDDGVSGLSSGFATAGVNGIYTYQSSEGSGLGFAGVWGDTNVTGAAGVLATADDGAAVLGYNNSAAYVTLYSENDATISGDNIPTAASFVGPGGYPYCYVSRDTSNNGTGDLVCTGTKSAAVPVEGNRMVRLYAVEAADNWFEDAGSGQLASGAATVPLDPAFAQTVNGDLDYHVFITPNGECEGLYVTNKTASGFEVRELHSGHSSIAFDYRIMARRKGFENVRMQDVSAQFAHMKDQADLRAAQREAGKAAAKAHPRPQTIPLSKTPSSRPVRMTQLVPTIRGKN